MPCEPINSATSPGPTENRKELRAELKEELP